ncbi:MAG: serine/threonine protein kinase, partial [Lentisphaerae bacterium]
MRFRCKQCSAINVMNQAQPGSTIKCGKCAAVLTVPEHAASPNVVFGDFVIIEVWNKHSHETDFIAEQISTQRRCLLKIPAQPIQNDKEVLQRYIARIRKIASFSHPFHADIITMGKDNDLVFVVTQLPQGESLKKHLTEQGTFLWNDALRFIGETAEVLHHAYQKTGLAHLNLKPDYLFLDPYGHATVTDIGFAAFKIDEDDEKIIGTPQYISPERIVGLDGDFRSDLYSLGIIAFMMLTGEMPYPGSSGQEFIQHHLNTTPAKVRQHNPKLPEFLDHIIDRMLQKNPEQRYQTWAELNVDLQRASQPSRETSSPQRETDITETVKETKGGSAESEPLKPGTLKVRIEGDSKVSLLQPTQHDPAKSSNSIIPTPEEGVKVKPPVNQHEEDDVI